MIKDINKIIIEYLKKYKDIKFLTSIKLENFTSHISRMQTFNNKIYLIYQEKNLIFELIKHLIWP